jgi:hypothetical protein
LRPTANGALTSIIASKQPNDDSRVLQRRSAQKKLLQIWVDGDRETESRLEQRDYFAEEDEQADTHILSSTSSTYILESTTPRVHQLPIRQLGEPNKPHFEPPHSSSSTQTYYQQNQPLNAAYLQHENPVQVTTVSNMPSNSAKVYNNISLGLRIFILVSL